jgi:hypothetical protein
MFPAAATHLGYTLEQDTDAPEPQANRTLMVQLGRWRAANPEYPDVNMLTQVAKRLLADCSK